MVELCARLRVTGVPHQRLWNHGTVLRLVMTQVCTDCPRPINVGVTRSTRTLRTIERASQSLACVVFQLAHEVVHCLANYLTGRFQGLGRNRSTQRDQIGDQMDIRSEEHTSELQSRFGISYAVFC